MLLPSAVGVINDFNSRAHVERDMMELFAKGVKDNISTHALTWSATEFNRKEDDSAYAFQLTRSRGARRRSHRSSAV